MITFNCYKEIDNLKGFRFVKWLYEICIKVFFLFYFCPVMRLNNV